MGILDRVTRIVKTGAAVALAPAPDPRVTHLTSQQRQRALLAEVAAAGREVSSAKERLRSAAAAVHAKLPAMEEQAREELGSGREAAARLALRRRQVVIKELETLEGQLAEVEREESTLAVIEQRLAGQIEAFAARQEVIKARYSAAEAQVRISEAMTGVSEGFEDLAATLERAERTTEEMQARSAAIDRLVADGHLGGAGFTTRLDAIDSRYDALDGEAEVDRQLASLREPDAPPPPTS